MLTHLNIFVEKRKLKKRQKVDGSKDGNVDADLIMLDGWFAKTSIWKTKKKKRVARKAKLVTIDDEDDDITLVKIKNVVNKKIKVEKNYNDKFIFVDY